MVVVVAAVPGPFFEAFLEFERGKWKLPLIPSVALRQPLPGLAFARLPDKLTLIHEVPSFFSHAFFPVRSRRFCGDTGAGT